MRQEKRKKRGREKAKSKSQECFVTFKPKARVPRKPISANRGLNLANIAEYILSHD